MECRPWWCRLSWGSFGMNYMKIQSNIWSRLAAFCAAMTSLMNPPHVAAAVVLPNPVVFVTQVPIPRELNSSVSNTFLSVVTLFGNHQADSAHAARGGDLMLLMKNGGLVNLTRAAGFGAAGNQDRVGISVRDPLVHWDGTRMLFSMVVGAATGPADKSVFHWQ